MSTSVHWTGPDAAYVILDGCSEHFLADQSRLFDDDDYAARLLAIPGFAKGTIKAAVADAQSDPPPPIPAPEPTEVHMPADTPSGTAPVAPIDETAAVPPAEEHA